MRFLALLLALACADSTAPADDGTTPPGSLELRLVEVAAGLQSPVHVAAPSGDARLFVVEQPGRIRIIRNGALLERAFLDITAQVGSGGERGLLSVAFHPNYAANGRFYVNYTDTSGDTRVERYTVSADADVADAASASLVLAVAQPFGNHNGGQVAFGPDGMLYIGMGDGGSGGDPLEHGQNLATLLGALLRIDVDAGEPYALPSDNPFTGTLAARAEIWAYGLRNPWRFHFDPPSGLLYIADVGQNQWEEIHVEPADSGGVNYGWNVMEGRHCYGGGSCDQSGLALPVLEYSHGDGCSVSGGAVYRGQLIPELRGHYFYADYCGGWIRSFRMDDGAAVDRLEWIRGAGNVTSFGTDAAGEMYLVTGAGRVFRIERAALALQRLRP
ncbi:MAG: PQQ-dependent sugar dehydrogenase [Gemmatimonadota bacterium]